MTAASKERERVTDIILATPKARFHSLQCQAGPIGFRFKSSNSSIFQGTSGFNHPSQRINRWGETTWQANDNARKQKNYQELVRWNWQGFGCHESRSSNRIWNFRVSTGELLAHTQVSYLQKKVIIIPLLRLTKKPELALERKKILSTTTVSLCTDRTLRWR